MRILIKNTINLILPTILTLNVACSRITPQVSVKEAEIDEGLGEVAQRPQATQAPGTGLLTIAAFEGDLEKVKELLEKGSYINENIGESQTQQVTPLMAALVNKQELVAKYLLQSGASTSLRFDNISATEIARFQNQFELLKQIGRFSK